MAYTDKVYINKVKVGRGMLGVGISEGERDGLAC